MLLKDADGPNRLMIRVTGYQFPDAPDPARQFSWHMVGGKARCQEGSWRFHWQALTCDESPQVSAWLREAAGSVTQRRALPEPLQFLEPNLMFRAFPPDGDWTRIQVSFDLEFQPPWHCRRSAGDPFVLSFTIDEEQLRQAAEQWDAERAPFPDRPTNKVHAPRRHTPSEPQLTAASELQALNRSAAAEQGLVRGGVVASCPVRACC